jgi:uncharacterized protein with PIN domain
VTENWSAKLTADKSFAGSGVSSRCIKSWNTILFEIWCLIVGAFIPGGCLSYRFIVDTPLGRLAKWLRILGFDTAYVPETGEKEIGYFSEKERIVIVRPSKMGSFQDRTCCPVASDRVFDQLATIRDHFGLTLEDTCPFSRCIRCNQIIEPAFKNDIRGMVPDYVWQTHAEFSRCDRCGRIYWRGSHAERSRNTILKLFH